jgi:2-amino-4-hydroxy-6-hydroxymethyldihydropteridine diphosphokinase
MARSAFTMRAGIAFGSNLGDRGEHLRAGRRAIAALPGATGPVLASPVYETDPVGCEPDAPQFWNAVIEIGFTGEPAGLLRHLRRIEASLGRPADHPRNHSRSIDLDLLYFGEERIDTPGLQLPHPRLRRRRFVLEPLAQIRGDLVLPGERHSVRELLAHTEGSAKVVAQPANWS